MDAVIKVGGSLASSPSILKAFCRSLGSIAEKHQAMVVPGGGEFADIVRDLDKRYFLNPITAHRMAILGMDQYGLLLGQLIPNSMIAQTITEVLNIVESSKLAVFLPSTLVLKSDSLEVSWDVTSDSIAAYIASRMCAKKLILVTDVDGIFTDDPKINPEAKLIREISTSDLLKQSKRTSVDKFLPRFLAQTNLDCFIINGAYPKRLEWVLGDKNVLSTRILTK